MVMKFADGLTQNISQLKGAVSGLASKGDKAIEAIIKQYK